jgi:hypothetical protein
MLLILSTNRNGTNRICRVHPKLGDMAGASADTDLGRYTYIYVGY